MIRSVMMMSNVCSSISRSALAPAGGHDALVADPLEALGHGRRRGVRRHRPQGRGSAGPSASTRLFVTCLHLARARLSSLLTRTVALAGCKQREMAVTLRGCRRSAIRVRRWRHRQAKRELRPLARVALDLDGAAVSLDDLPRGRQTQAAAAGASRVEGVEDPGRGRPRSCPSPVSITSSTIQRPSRRVVMISSPPSAMACSALSIRLSTACLNRSASMTRRGRSGAK